MANRGAIVEPLVSGAALKGSAKAATFTTDGFSLNVNGARVGYYVDLTVTGTTPTLDIDFEITMDGTDYGQMHTATTAQTEADMDQITATGRYYNWFESGIPFGDDTGNYKVRVEHTIGGTNPSFTFNECKFFCWTPSPTQQG